MARTRKYSDFTEDEKQQFANKIAKDLNKALYQTGGNIEGGTQEASVASIANVIRTIGGPNASELVDKVSAAKNEKGASYFKKGGGNLRSALVKDYSYGDEDAILNAFGYATDNTFGDSDQAALAKLGKGINNSSFKDFGRVTSLDDLPEGAGALVTNVSETEQDIPEFYDLGFKPMDFYEEGDPDFVGAPNPYKTGGSVTGTGTSTGTGTGGSTPKPNTDKVDALKAARDKQVRLSGAEGPYGYKGGYDQMVKDQAILKPTRLGQREADGGFRLRSAAERQARIREGQFDMQEPKRIVMENFRNRYGDGAGGSRLEQEMKQFQKDTGVKDPLKLESDTKNKEAVARDLKRAKERKEVLNRYRVKEPEPYGKEVAALNTEDRAKVMGMVREEEKNKNSGVNNYLGK